MSESTKQVYDSALQSRRDARAELIAILAVRADNTDESKATHATWFGEPGRRAQVDVCDAVLFALESIEAELGYRPS